MESKFIKDMCNKRKSDIIKGDEKVAREGGHPPLFYEICKQIYKICSNKLQRNLNKELLTLEFGRNFLLCINIVRRKL